MNKITVSNSVKVLVLTVNIIHLSFCIKSLHPLVMNIFITIYVCLSQFKYLVLKHVSQVNNQQFDY